MDPAVAEQMRRLYADYDLRTGVPKLLEIAHPEIEIVVAAGWLDMKTEFHGADGVREYFGGLLEAFGNMRYELVALEEHGDALVADIVVHVEGRESGAATSLPVFQVLWFEDGLLRRVQGFTDRSAALAAVA